jgi:endo-1,4-beta-xylanase
VIHRRLFLASAAALAGCGARSEPAVSIRPLRDAAPFPVGVAVQAEQLDDPAYAALLAQQASQVTPEWQMKMEYIVGPDGAFRFDAPDRIAAFARAHGMRLFGHTLVWYAEAPAAFVNLDESRIAFRDAYANYITAVVGRYRGQAVGWDVVNEAVNEDGHGWRENLWSRKLGLLEHMRLAYEIAQAADPNATLLLNDYYLELLPRKRATYLRLAEALLKAGAPLGGLGCQTHVNADLRTGAIKEAIADLASLGLPIHISEMDVSRARVRGLSADGWAGRQQALYAEAAEAFMALPPSQRFAFTVWGLRDSDSWLRKESASDAPLLFDPAGRPKPASAALESAFARNG